MILQLFILLSWYSLTSAYPDFQNKIPNGANVVDSNGEAWPGVGHLRSAGGGPRNPFGLDFFQAGKNWTQALCEKDSDGDGRTNGQELGDPQCLWSQGEVPQFTTGITHPGFSNPGATLNVDTCENFQMPSGTKTATLTFTSYAVQTTTTSYLKQAFTFPEEGHIVRFDIIIDQPSVVHHMILYKCSQDVSSTFGTPSEGGMPCSEVIFAWALGGKDYCFPHNLGMYIAKTGRYLALEIHYDNPKLASGIADSSGYRVHYVPGNTLTASSWLWVGSTINQISIPPGLDSYEIQSVCDLSDFKKTGSPVTINLFASIMHGHKLARKIWVSKYNKDSPSAVHDIACNSNYDFDLQEVIPMSTEIPVTTRDVLTVHCVYDSTSRTSATQGGDATEDEMCIGLFMFYPRIGNSGLKCWRNVQAVGDGTKKCGNGSSYSLPPTIPSDAKIIMPSVVLSLLFMVLTVSLSI